MKHPDWLDTPTLRWVADREEEEAQFAQNQGERLRYDNPMMAQTWRIATGVHRDLRRELRRTATLIEKERSGEPPRREVAKGEK